LCAHSFGLVEDEAVEDDMARPGGWWRELEGRKLGQAWERPRQSVLRHRHMYNCGLGCVPEKRVCFGVEYGW